MALFKKFEASEVNTRDNAKANYARKIKEELIELYPEFEGTFNLMIPKKEPTIVYKTKSKYSFICFQKEIAFFHHDKDTDGMWLPTVKFIQKYPTMLPKLQVDRGAIPFVLKGAPIMTVGITSPGGKIFNDVPAGTVVGIFAEDKEAPIAVGITTVSTKEMKEAGAKGEGVNNVHFMGDGLWAIKGGF
jgi:PUA domain protein